MQNGLMILEIFGQHTSLYFKTLSSQQLASYVSYSDQVTRSTLTKLEGLEVQKWLDNDMESPNARISSLFGARQCFSKLHNPQREQLNEVYSCETDTASSHSVLHFPSLFSRPSGILLLFLSA